MTISRVSLLVSTNQLREKLSSVWRHSQIGKELRILDSSYDFDEQNDGYKEFYKQGHIQSAVYFDPKRCVESTQFIPFNLPDVNCFTDYVQSLGVSSNTHIITYDRLDSRAAFRTWWLFRLYGHNKISVLDGGLKKWVRDGYHVTTEEPTVERGDFESKVNPMLMRDFNSMKDVVNSKNEQVVDARESETFNKVVKTESGEMKNYIPGARSLPFATLFNSDGTFKSANDLKEVFKIANVDLDHPMVTMCGRGILACGLTAAAELLGKHNTPLYYGSWYEWSRKVAKPN